MSQPSKSDNQNQPEATGCGLRCRAADDNSDVRQAVAADPKAPAALLRKLAGDDDPAVREAVAATPNAPLEMLWALAEEYPEVVVENPALRLTVAADLNTLETAPLKAIEVLLKQEQVPTPWLRWGSKHGEWDLHQAVACNPQAPSDLLRQLAKDSWSVREAVARNPSTSVELLEQLAAGKWSRMSESGLRKAVAEHPSAPTEALELLRRAGADAKLEKVGCDPEPLTDAEQERLLDWGPYARRLLAAHPDTTPEQLEQLAAYDDLDPSEAVPGRPHAILLTTGPT